MIATQYINLNMIPSGVLPILYCSQYDIGRPLGVIVHSVSEPVDLDSYTVTIEATRTDKTPITAEVITDNNIGVFVTTAIMTNKADKYPAKLVLSDNQSHRVASLAFIMCVTPKTMDENAESIEEDASLYQQYTGTVQSLIADIRADVSDLNSHFDGLDNQVDGIITLVRFDGTTDEQRIYDALITKEYRGAIYGGNITINSSIALPNATVRETKITNAVITLNADMFTAASGNIARLPSFVNCKFIGNGHAIYGSNYAVFGDFIGCSFIDCALIKNTSGTVQSAYMYACEVLNNTVPFIRANNLYDVKIDGMVCEAQSATLIDTINSTGAQGGPRSLWITNSIFEGFTNLVFNLAGGGPGVCIQRCYFEANDSGCLYLKKSSDGYDYLMLEISDCKVNSNVIPFEISGFTNNYRVKVSVHDNYYYTSVTGTPMVKGIPVDNLFALYNNRPSYPTDVFSDQARYIYKPEEVYSPGVDSSYFTQRGGGYIQFGSLVFVNMYLKALSTTATNINNALTGMPKPRVSRVRLEVRSQADESLYSNKYVLLTTADPASGTFVGGTTEDDGYIIKGFYFTTNKAVY